MCRKTQADQNPWFLILTPNHVPLPYFLFCYIDTWKSQWVLFGVKHLEQLSVNAQLYPSKDAWDHWFLVTQSPQNTSCYFKACVVAAVVCVYVYLFDKSLSFSQPII